MNKLLRLTLAIAVGLGVLLVPTAAHADVRGCSITAEFNALPFNGMAWSTSDNEAYHTPMMRAGSCGHVYVINLSVYNAPACQWAKVKTYNENRTLRVNGAWKQLPSVGSIADLRPTIDNMRLFRVYVYGCEPFRDSHFWPGIDVYAHG